MRTLSISTFIILTFESISQSSNYKTFEKNTLEGIRVGVINLESGKETVPPIYDKVGDYSEGRFPVILGNKIGLIDTIGKIIIPIKYADLFSFVDKNGFVQDVKTKKWAMVNINGIFKTQFIYDDIVDIRNGVATVVVNRKVGFIDGAGKQILPCKFTEGYSEGGLILVYEKSFESIGYEYVTTDAKGNITNKQNIGFEDKMPIVFNAKGQIVYKGNQWERVRFVSEFNIFVVKNGDGKEKIVSKHGKEVVSYAENVEVVILQDRVLLKKNKGYDPKKNDNVYHYGIVTLSGVYALKPIFSEISAFEYKDGELARISFPNNEFFYVDKSWHCIEFDNVKCPQ